MFSIPLSTVSLLFLLGAAGPTLAASSGFRPSPLRGTVPPEAFLVRGGDQAPSAPRRVKARKRRRGDGERTQRASHKNNKNDNDNNKKNNINNTPASPEIQAVLRNDPAQFLGDTIRQRGEELLLQQVSVSLHSLKWGLGASDYTPQDQAASVFAEQRDGAYGDETDAASLLSPSAVIAQYFVKSHGGAHAFQTLCSLLSSASGVGALGFMLRLPNAYDKATNTIDPLYQTRYLLSLHMVRRACLWAMIQHLSGMLAAAVVTAQAIPMVGLRQARGYMQETARDPLAQYVFVAASVLLWLPQQTQETTWWMTQQWSRFVPVVLVGPILLRELVSVAWVVSDVMVLSTLGKTSDHATKRTVQTILLFGRALTDAVMSILVTPSTWRNADAARRQAILAQLVSHTSLALELAIGALMVLEFTGSLVGLLLWATPRPTLGPLLRRGLCAYLYVVFLSTRRRRIESLVGSIRGGAAELPMYCLDVLLRPRQSMGLVDDHGKSIQSCPPVPASLALAQPETEETWRRRTWRLVTSLIQLLNDD